MVIGVGWYVGSKDAETETCGTLRRAIPDMGMDTDRDADTQIHE